MLILFNYPLYSKEVKLLTIEINVNKKNFRGCTFITGFHGIGETGYIAASYLIHALKADRIGFIKVAKPPPFISTSASGIITPFELYRKKKLVIFKLEFPPHRSEEINLLREIASWIVKMRFKDAILVGGLDSSFKQDKSIFRSVPTSRYKAKKRSMKINILDQGLFVYGPLATLLAEFEILDFPAIAILPYADSNRADPGAAAVTESGIHISDVGRGGRAARRSAVGRASRRNP